METKNFAARMAELFKRDGQSSTDFMKEFKALDASDRAWYHRELNACGYPTSAPAGQ